MKNYRDMTIHFSKTWKIIILNSFEIKFIIEFYLIEINMQTQSASGSETLVEGEWREKSAPENDYNYIVNNGQDRYQYMEKFMEGQVVETLKKTAKSYNKKRKLRSPKKIAKRAAQRMVHGDEDPWRKKCESYGFMLAKSMIMMNSEIHKERMKPKNIYADIGRDQWEYINDSHIGTGKSWNRNVLDSQMQPEMYLNDEAAESDTLMRATGPSGDIKTTGSFGGQLQSPMTEQNMANINEYSNVEVLHKEFTLGKDLLERAIEKIDRDAMENLSAHENATEDDLSAVNVFFKMIAMLENQEAEPIENWADITGFNEETVDKLNNIPKQIENKDFEKEQVDILRDEFQMKNQENEIEEIRNIKEALCEAF